MIQTALITLLLFSVVGASPLHAEGKMYRWVDKQGKVHYSDTLPETAIPQEKVVYDKEHGRKIKVIEKAKSPEELAREARLRELRKEEKRLLAEQLARDRALLRTYRNEEDLKLALQGQLNTIEARIRVLGTNISRHQSQLENAIQQAATMERNGRRVPASLKNKIAAIRNQINEFQTQIEREEQLKEKLEQKFVQDLERFRRLLEHYAESKKKTATTRPDSEPSDSQRIILSVVTCQRDVDCERAWQLARIYAQTHATTPLFINGHTIIHTKDPFLDEDIALTIARITGDSEHDILFLDVRCKLSSVGQDLCRSDKVREIRRGFPAFIREALRSSSKQSTDTAVGK